MKPILNFTAYILLIIVAANTSCNKDKPVSSVVTPPPPPLLPSSSSTQGKTIKARVVEYNRGNPIAGAEISLRQDYPNGNTLNLTTDQNGAFSFITSINKFGYISLGKPGYWSLLPNYDFASPIIFYPDSTIYNPSATFYSSDSFVVKLFPVWNITVHVKDTSGYNRNAGFTSHGLFSLNGTTYNRYGSWMVLHSGIDTTFQLPIFGNADNKFGIWKSYDDDYFIWNEIQSQVQYIAVGNSSIVNVFY